MSGKNTSRIDTIFSSQIGSRGCLSFTYGWKYAHNFDHVPLTVTLRYGAYDEDINTITNPVRLDLPSPPLQKEKRKEYDKWCNGTYTNIWNTNYKHKFDIAMNRRQPDEAYLI